MPTADTSAAVLDDVDVTVIGAGQAGLSVAHHLQRRGIDGPRLRVVDAEDGPGGAWRHRWPTLTVAALNGIFELPEQRQRAVAASDAASAAVPAWFAEYERDQGFQVLRPVEVDAVRQLEDPHDDRLAVTASIGRWRTRAVVSCTGTWRRPFWPTVPGMATFTGRQLHTHDYPGPAPFAGQRVAVVGGGVSGAGHVIELAEVAETRWITRRPPDWRRDDFKAEHGRAVIERVQARVRDGRRSRSVVAETGLADRGRFGEARRSGVLAHHPMFARLGPDGPVWEDGTRWPADAIVWATGFRPEIDHLAPLRLRTQHGGIRVEGSLALDDHRVHLVGYGPSASTVGANRYGRDAAIALSRWINS
ncbi:MAG: cation diffusion facilitator CzcD-associated flavoprotein CzcO [Nonlabens sp.]|jgi:cation diffusion facilitator CzcD-associated flavoprotein CzcO